MIQRLARDARRACASCVLLLSVTPFVVAQQSTVTVVNSSHMPRVEWARASVPFAQGQIQKNDPIPFNVDWKPTEWRPLQYWPDGSLKSAQAQWLEVLGGGEKAVRKIQKGTLRAKPFALHPAISDAAPLFRIFTSVMDRDGVPYIAEARPFDKPGNHVTVLHGNHATYSVRTRSYHVNPQNKGIGRDYFSQTCYFTFFSEIPIAVVDVVVANDYLGSDSPKTNDPNMHPLGDIGFKSLDFFVAGARGVVRYPDKNEVGVHMVDTFMTPSTQVNLLTDDYLGDAQGKRWRVIVVFDSPRYTPGERSAWTNVAASWFTHSMIPTVDLATWQRTKAFGLYGGPVDPSTWGPVQIREDYDLWLQQPHFGAWADWGDYTHTWVTGTHRNGPSTEHKILAVQHQDPRPLYMLEGKAWQQTARPYQIWDIRIEPNDDIYMWDGLPYTLASTRRISAETLGRYDLRQNDPYSYYRKDVPIGYYHRWNAYEPEHFSAELLFDYFSMTGDWRCLDEMRMLGECYMGCFRHQKYQISYAPLSARGEGWPAQAAIKIWFATGDDRLIRHLQRRIREIIEPKREKNHPSKAISFAPQHPLTLFPTPNTAMLPWQHAAIIYGYYPLWQYWGDKTARQIVHDMVSVVEYSWVFNYNDPVLGFLPDVMRYYVPITYQNKPCPPDIWDNTQGIGVRYGDLPLGGAHTFFAAALDILAEDTTDPIELAKNRYARKHLMHDKPNTDRWRYSRWFSLREPPK
ncbi:MAG: hypothetical protein H6832_15925 [Planctomycetes bacterium]|nr:hypothetical protein [Planctomycetota bacterium]